MKTIKLIFAATLSLFVFFKTQAQLNVNSSGYVGIGIGNTAPLEALQVGGNAVFTTIYNRTPGTQYMPMIVCDNTGTTTTATTPDYTWLNDSITGIFHPGAWQIGFTTDGVERLHIHYTGNVGIGTNSPSQLFQVNGNTLLSGTSSKLMINDTGYYVGLARNGSDFLINNNESSLLRLGSNDGIGFYAKTTGGNDANSYSGTNYNMFLNQYGLGIGASAQAWSGNAFYVNGNSYFSGTGYSTGAWTSSDSRFKTNIQPIDSAMQKVMKLNGKFFVYNQSAFSQYFFNPGINFGFIAQELMRVLPQTVRQEHDGYYSVNYEAIIPILTEAIKSQNKRIDSLQNQINSCCNNTQQGMKVKNGSNSDETVMNADILNENAVSANSSSILYQNTPNPFSQQTNIMYYIPTTSQGSSIIIFDLQGKLIKSLIRPLA